MLAWSGDGRSQVLLKVSKVSVPVCVGMTHFVADRALWWCEC